MTTLRNLSPIILVLVFFVDSLCFDKPSISNWSEYSMKPDSIEYASKFKRTSLTPPIYHWFIHVATWGDSYIKGKEIGHHSLKEKSFSERILNPFYRVVFQQFSSNKCWRGHSQGTLCRKKQGWNINELYSYSG